MTPTPLQVQMALRDQGSGLLELLDCVVTVPDTTNNQRGSLDLPKLRQVEAVFGLQGGGEVGGNLIVSEHPVAPEPEQSPSQRPEPARRHVNTASSSCGSGPAGPDMSGDLSLRCAGLAFKAPSGAHQHQSPHCPRVIGGQLLSDAPAG